MLEQVRAKDAGPAGDALSRMVQKLRELDVSGVDPNERPGLIARLLGVKNDVQKYVDKYDDVRGQVDRITNELEQHKTKLLTDIVRLDKLYDANLDYFRMLEVYIAAGRAKLKEADESTIPQLAAKVAVEDDVIAAQKLRDLRAARDDLERRVHDLLLTRQVTMQSLPSIRLIQENDKSLVTKINSTVANTVPLWRQQLAQAITIYRMGDAANAVKAASDLTNELLQANAENLKRANAVGAQGGRARRVRHRIGPRREPEADRDHRREPPDRRRGQAPPCRGRDPAPGLRGRAAAHAGVGLGPGAGHAGATVRPAQLRS